MSLKFSFLLISLLAASSAMAEDSATQFTIDDAHALIEREEYVEAIHVLDLIVENSPNDATPICLLGFANLKSGQLGDAARLYAQALEINPLHLNTLENQGELFLLIDRPSKAKANLDLIQKICGNQCEEYRNLKNLVEAYPPEG